MFDIGFLEVTVWDILDILIFGYFLFLLYKLLKGAVAFYILLGLGLLYGLGWLFQLLDMGLMSSMFTQFTNLGVILLIVVFQPEIRQFLIMLGSTAMKSRYGFLKRLTKMGHFNDQTQLKENIVNEVKGAILSMAKHKTGALIILAKEEHLTSLRSTGVRLDSRISQLIIESIFEKNSPMHDGAMIIVKNRIYAASSILPLSYDPNLPLKYGLRHRAAIGISEMSDVYALVISEESGSISFVHRGKIESITDAKTLEEILLKYDF